MSKLEIVFGLTGAVLGAGVASGAFWANGCTHEPTRHGPTTTTIEDDDAPLDAGGDPAMAANADLVERLEECSRSLARATQSSEGLGRQIEAERLAEVDASRAARARRLARRDPSAGDWANMAKTGTIRYVLPCASFRPSPEELERLGLSSRDVPTVQSAFTAARDTAWAQIRPLCAAAVGGAATADRLGLDSCPQVILDAERASNPGAAEGAMRAVGAVRAGTADPSTIPSDDPIGAAFSVLTGVAKDAESRLGVTLGPDMAHSAVYDNGACSRSTEFTSGARASE